MSDEQQPGSADPGRRYELFLPVLLVIVAVTAWFAFQTVQLVKERSSLTRLKAGQEQTLQNAQKMRAQLDSIAGGVARLAEQGNADAKLVVKALRDRGIVLHPDKADTKGPSK